MKTTIKLLRPDEAWQPKIGAPKRNRNALKGGFHTDEARALRRQIAAVLKRANVAVAEVQKRLPRRKPGPKPGSKQSR